MVLDLRHIDSLEWYHTMQRAYWDAHAGPGSPSSVWCVAAPPLGELFIGLEGKIQIVLLRQLSIALIARIEARARAFSIVLINT